MAQSKFLEYQDKTGDGLPDVCEDVVEVAEPICVECQCIENSSAIVDNWREADNETTYLNGSNCLYEVIIETNHATTGAEDCRGDDTPCAAAAITEIFEEYVDQVVEVLITAYNKEDTTSIRAALRDSLDHTDYYLDARPYPASTVKLLYSVPYSTVCAIGEATAASNTAAAEAALAEETVSEKATRLSQETDESFVITYTVAELKEKLIQVRKSLFLYQVYLSRAQAIDGVGLYYQDGLLAGKVFSLDIYAGSVGGFSMAGLLKRILPQLTEFLSTYNYKIYGVYGGFKGMYGDRVEEFSFRFSSTYVLKELRIMTEECRDVPVVFSGNKLSPLIKKSAWGDPTAMAYMVNLDDMIVDLTAREPLPWLDFLLKHTYPTIYSAINQGYTNTDPEDSVGSCVAEALQEEAKQLGQDIFSGDFSVTDVFAEELQKGLCIEDRAEYIENNTNIFRIEDPDNPEGGGSAEDERIWAVAKAQAFETLAADDAVFDDLCALVLNGQNDLIDILGALFNIKICGLKDAQKEALTCLMGQLTLEEALSAIAESALRAMSVENFGDLLIGLPADKQAELDALVKQKFESGEFFREGTAGEAYSDSVATTAQSLNYTEPWSSNYEGYSWEQGLTNFQAAFGAGADRAARSPLAEWQMTWPRVDGQSTCGNVQTTDDNERRTLIEQYDFNAQATDQLDANTVAGAYIIALTELYDDALMELLEEMNKIPGEELIMAAITAIDCPTSPIPDPSFLDWINDRQIPICRTTKPIAMPPLINPGKWLPTLYDLPGVLFEALKYAIQQAIFHLLQELIKKICGIISGAACGALGAAGAGLASLGNRSTIADAVQEAICGDDVDPEIIDDTLVDLLETMGTGATDPEEAVSFFGDVSMVLTADELYGLFLGDCPSYVSGMIGKVILYEHPDFAEGLNNAENICKCFENMGNIFPADFKDKLRDFRESVPEAEEPANPSLCAAPEQIEAFKEAREELLEGRATPEQIEKFGAPSGTGGPDGTTPTGGGPLDELKDLADLVQGDVSDYLGDNLPTLISDPGCDNGLLPYETEEAAATAVGALNGNLEQLKVDIAYDMMGNGPGEANWGLMNMVLSDTMGYPYTAHLRKAAGFGRWVDFYVDPNDPDAEEGDEYDGLGRVPRYKNQRGAYPYKVAAWLEDFMQDGRAFDTAAGFASNNAASGDTTYSVDFGTLNINAFNGNLEIRKLPQLGYNTQISPNMEKETVDFILPVRKKTPDFTLSYQDNVKGLHNDARFDGEADPGNSTTELAAAGTGNTIYKYGFDLECYLSDIVSGSVEGIRNYPGDNARITIVDKYNANARTWTTVAAMIPALMPFYNKIITTDIAIGDSEFTLKPNNDEPTTANIDSDNRMEFFATDDTLDGIDLSSYPNFLATFETEQSYLPQIVLLYEMLGGALSKDTIKTDYDAIMTAAMDGFINLIVPTEADDDGESDAFLYGATYDNLTFNDIEYVLGDIADTHDVYTDSGGDTAATGDTAYSDAYIYDEDKEEYRKLKNADMLLGMSRMEYEDADNNRVFYLDPALFGGNYMNPPLHVKPVKNKGWLGFVDVLFPEMSPCKPYRTDLIDFNDIQEQIENSYPTIPEDERLKSDPDCIIEVPYARILDRASLSSIESIITAAIRVYVSTFFIKSMATFTKFYPKFPGVFSNIYAAYIIAEMEASFKDAQKPVWEKFNPFKDDDFWYAFLEQSVQLYSRRVDSGDISDPPQAVIDALVRLNDEQMIYDYPSDEDRDDARQAGDFGKLKYLGKRGLRNYRQKKNLDAVARTADDAKVALKELVIEQLNYMGEKFVENLKTIGMSPDIIDLDYYLLQKLSQGGSALTLNQEIVQTYAADYPDIDDPDDHYTAGNAFALPDGSAYTGYYHVELGDDGETIFVTGASSGDSVEGGEILTPFASITIVDIGDIDWIGTASADDDETDTTQPFVIEKYIKVDGSYLTYDQAMSQFGSSTDLISDVYPGTLSLVVDDSGNTVGLEGELGVRHGLRFAVIIDGAAQTVVEVEVDALDVSLQNLDPLEGNTKLLLCLINLLREDDKFKLVTQYVFPFKKLAATLAIYNGLAFLPSIGEKVAADGQTYGKSSITTDDDGEDLKTAPGSYLEFPVEGENEDSAVPGTPEVVDSVDNPGSWASKLDRDPGLFGGIFVREWDAWDQTLLRNSRSRIKKIFKSFYNGRDFKPGDIAYDSPGAVITDEFKSRFKAPAGQNLLPWWKKRMLRTNPFNANGELCEEKD